MHDEPSNSRWVGQPPKPELKERMQSLLSDTDGRVRHKGSYHKVWWNLFRGNDVEL
jgi:hypothetical protein